MIFFNEEHSLKTPSSISVNDEGIDTSDNDEQPLKAFFPIDVIEEGIETWVKDEHSEKDSSPIDEIGGIDICVILFILLNCLLQISIPFCDNKKLKIS